MKRELGNIVDNVDGLSEWLSSVPYKLRRQGQLYRAEELYQGYEPSDDEAEDKASFATCYDSRVDRKSVV